jgi:hypothetical protein
VKTSENLVLFSANPGNLSRCAAVRQSLISTRTDEALVLLLGHPQSEIVSAVTGVLVNVSADPTCKTALLRPASALLVSFSDLLRRVSFKDLHLSTLICQVIIVVFAYKLRCVVLLFSPCGVTLLLFPRCVTVRCISLVGAVQLAIQRCCAITEGEG